MRLRVLLVEDDDAVREMMEAMLEALGCEVVSAADADEATRKLDRNGFRLLMTDIRMPGDHDGLALATEASKTHPELKFIYATGYSDDLEERLKTCPEGELLVKPFRMERLREALDRILAGDAEDDR